MKRLKIQQKLKLENRKLKSEVEKLKNELHIDHLTGLQNARSLREQLQSAIDKNFEKGLKPALLFIDLDYFKEINESHGHMAAGSILNQVGARIATLIRKEDIAFRYGGDGFVVLVNGGRSGARSVGERIRKALSKKAFQVQGLKGPAEVYLTASLGLRVVEKGDRAEKVLEDADRAMYQAKRKSRNTLVTA